MKKLKAIVVDDEELARKLVENFIGKFDDIDLVGSFKNAKEALPLLKKNEVDILFLDIQMPEISGIEFLKTLDQKPHVILATAYSEYAIEGYALDVSDYLLKPYSFDRFAKAILKVKEIIALEQRAEQGPDETTRSEKKDVLLVKSEHKIHRLSIQEINYIQGMREYVAYHMDDKRILSLNSLKSLEIELAENGFIRIHKSYLIDSNKVQMLEGNTLYVKGEKIPIGASYKEAVMKKLF